MKAVRGALAICLGTVAVGFGACGSDKPPPTVDDLPAELAKAIPHVESSGFQTDVVLGVLQSTPSLLVHADTPVVLTLVEPKQGDLASVGPFRDPDGSLVTTSLSIVCRNVTGAGSDGHSADISRVLSASRLC